MNWIMKKCVKCKRYTMVDICPICKGKVRVAHPARFSPVDKYVEYRISVRELNKS